MQAIDLGAAMLGALTDAARGLDVQTDYIDAQNQRAGAPCPVCGTEPCAQTPYRGVVLRAYIDALHLTCVPFWACKDCASLLGPVTIERVRVRIGEWTGRGFRSGWRAA